MWGGRKFVVGSLISFLGNFNVCCCCFCCCSKWVKKATRVTSCVKAAELEKEKWIVCVLLPTGASCMPCVVLSSD